MRLPSAGSSPSPSGAPDWTPEIAEADARALGIHLTPLHWRVLGCAREECLRTHHFPAPCAIAEASGISRAELEELFPGRTCELIARISGLSPGTSCGEDS